MRIAYRDVTARDMGRCIEIRGMTRDNPVPADVLREIGVTEESWQPLVRDNIIAGVVAETNDEVVGFCSGDTRTGEVLVLAVLPEYEGRGLGSNMLALVMDKLRAAGWDRLWLAASPDPAIRAHGFYRHLGWVYSGEREENGDEVLEYKRR
jgi:ribosomal protein S18 acetylase RimI-like enzyme